MNRYAFILLCLLVCLVVVGCGKNKKLTGKVTFTDGTPAKSGKVIFLQGDNFMATGEIKPDGSYKMSSERENDGIPPGDYKVYVSSIFKPPPAGVMAMPVSLCDPKFENPDTSGLKCKVPAPGNKYDIVLEPHPKHYP